MWVFLIFLQINKVKSYFVKKFWSDQSPDFQDLLYFSTEAPIWAEIMWEIRLKSIYFGNLKISYHDSDSIRKD